MVTISEDYLYAWAYTLFAILTIRGEAAFNTALRTHRVQYDAKCSKAIITFYWEPKRCNYK
jgi:hypothetical protein